jgi:hypothetical protein
MKFQCDGHSKLVSKGVVNGFWTYSKPDRVTESYPASSFAAANAVLYSEAVGWLENSHSRSSNSLMGKVSACGSKGKAKELLAHKLLRQKATHSIKISTHSHL